jgi:carboxyl-terminal processing protease
VVPDLILPDLNDAYEVGEGFQKYALPHDVIRPSAGFNPRDRQNLFIKDLHKKNGERIEKEQYFKYLRDDIDRAKAEFAENRSSLNREVRMAELKESEERRKVRRTEQIKRFAEVETEDKKTFTTYRLTLDDLEKESLPLLDLDDHSEDYIRRAVDEVADLEETLKWPSGIDSVKREGLHVLRDLVDAIRASRLAKIDE